MNHGKQINSLQVFYFYQTVLFETIVHRTRFGYFKSEQPFYILFFIHSYKDP